MITLAGKAALITGSSRGIGAATVKLFAQASADVVFGGRGMVAISFTSGQRGEAFHAHYCATKGAIISFVKGLATELARHNILVNCIAPGRVETDMPKPATETRARRKGMAAAIPLGRLVRPEEIVGPILFAASALASVMSGKVVNINGGAVLCG